MNKVDIIRKHVGDDEFYDMNGTSMLTNILNAMEEYKEQEVGNRSIPDIITHTLDEMAEIRQKVNCTYCGEKDTVSMITKQTKYSRSIKITRCEKCGKQNGVKAILTANTKSIE